MRAKTHFSSVKRVIAMALAVLMVVGVFQVGSHINDVKAATGDTPPHSKTIHDNGDGTYTISLDVVGESEKQPNNVNVIVVFDRSGSMANPNNSNQRLNAAKTAVNNLADKLYAYNTQSAPNTVQMALVSFSTNATVSRTPTNNATQFKNAVNSLTADGGTNWEAALDEAGNVNFGDDDQTFVIFVSDGNPTFRDTRITTDYLPRNDNPRWSTSDWNTYRSDNYYYNTWRVYGLGSDSPNQDNYSPTSMDRCYQAALPEAQAIVQAVGGDHFFTIGAYGDVSRMQTLTTAAGAPAGNFYNANDTAALNQALADILAKIEMMGIGNTSIDDGTTNQVTTTSGKVAELLEVDEDSYKYYRSGGDYGTMQEWADAPEATFENGSVKWDLASEGVLENGVRYTVTFDCYPSQETYDIIAQLKNGDLKYSELDSEIRKYIVDNGNGSYSLRTNTNATLSWDDTRDEAGQQTAGYTNPDPVKTDASTLTATKEWEGGEADVDSLKMTILMDDEPFHTSEMTKAGGWTTSSFISYGLIKNGKVLSGAEGHDFKFAELDDTQYHWELETPTVHPMIIDGTPTMLVMVDKDHPASGQTYTIDGKTYYVDSSVAGLTATNHRRSNLNLKKTVVGEDVPEDATFPFTLTVNNAKAPEQEPTDDPNHDSDYWVWFSIYDTKAGATVTDATVSGTGVVGPSSSGYYYAPSDTAISVEMKDGWNLRFTNLPSGTTYTFVEGDLETGFKFNKAELTAGEDSTFSGDQTTTGKIENTKTSYEVTYTNEYALVNVTVNKVWEDNNDQDGKRPEELALTLNGLPSGTTAPEPTIKKDGKTWTYTWEKLPKYDADGNEITYTVTEESVPADYEVSGSPAQNKGTITNTHETIKTTVKVTKSWEDDNNANKTRPDSISVQLKADGENVGQAQTLSGDDWTYTWENLDAYKAGEAIEYTVDEVEVDGYLTTMGEVTGTPEDGYEVTITNSNVTIPTDTDTFFKKTVTEGTEGKAATFTFTISGSEGAPMPANTTGTATYAAGETGDKTIDFGTITYSEEGTYTYTITETNTPAGWAATGNPATVTVTVSKDGSGKLTAEVSAGAITNAYSTGTVSVDPPVKKDITGTEELYNKGDFTFEISGSEGAPMPANTSITNSATYELPNREGYYEFGEITFTKPGTYTYEVTESGSALGVTNDSEATKSFTFTVTDNGDGTLSVSPSSDDAVFEFTNEYKTGELDITKTVVNEVSESDTTKFTFTVEITDAEGKAVEGEFPYTIGSTEGTITSGGTLQLAGGETAKITGIPDGANYKVTETEVSGYTADKTEATGTISADAPAEAAFTNTYGVDPTTFELKASKTLEVKKPANNPPDISRKFTFTITGADAETPLPENTSVTNPDGAGGEATFGEIEFTKPGTYQYTITEEGNVPGVTNGTLSYNVKIEVTDNGDGTMSVEVIEGDVVTAFTNTYKVTPAELEEGFKVTKSIEGTTLAAGAFEFEVTGAAPLPDPATATNDADGNVEFSKITYDEPGTYTYTIKEVNAGKSGYTYDDNEVKVTVEVKDNGEGELVAEVSYEGEKEFINTYEAKGEADLSVKKTLNGRALEDGQFEFELVDQATGEVLQTKTNNEAGQVVFDPIKYTQEIFNEESTSEETPAEGNSTDAPAEEIEKTEAVEPETTEEAVEEPVAEETVIEEPAAPEEEAVEAPAEEEIVLASEEEEAAPEEEAVVEETEVVEEAEEEPAYEETVIDETEEETPVVEETEEEAPVEEETVVEETEEIPEETAEEIELAEAGRFKEFTYIIREKNDGKPGYTYDTHEVTVTVTVTDDDEGNLDTDISYSGATTFENKYEAEGEAQFEGTKTLETDVEGKVLEEGQFTFELKKGNEVIGTVTNAADGSFSFDAVSFTEADAGKDITYTISEVNDGKKGYTYDGHICDVTVKVTDNGDGTLDCAVTYSDGDKAAFDNKYKPLPTTAKVKGTKSLTGKNLKDGEFTFELKDEEGKVVATATNKADGSIEFEELKFEKEGTYTYTVTEVKGDDEHMTYDESEFKITITVTDNEGQLKAEIEGDELEFENEYTPDLVDVVIEGTKTLTGRTLKEGEFTFELTDENGDVTEATNGADGSIVFNLGKKDEGTYTYTVTEVKGDDKDISYDKSEFTITVTVKNENGVLKATVKGNGFEFVNKYNPSPTPHTGDNTNMWLWVAIMLAAGLELASLIYVRVRKNK